jgi:hypothetical protein
MIIQRLKLTVAAILVSRVAHGAFHAPYFPYCVHLFRSFGDGFKQQ